MSSPTKPALLHARVSHGQSGLSGPSIFELYPADLNQNTDKDSRTHI